MENVLNVERRNPDGKGGARKLRRSGLIPGVLYGHKEKSLSFAVDPRVLERKVNTSGYGRNTVLKIMGLDREVLALVKTTQVDPLRRTLQHIDLIEVRETEKVEVEVPLEVVGRSKGVFLGGSLQQVRRKVGVNCTPLTIPKSIKIDVTELDLNDTLHISDVNFPEGTTSSYPGSWSILTIAAPAMVAEASEDEGEAAAEGAAPAAD